MQRAGVRGNNEFRAPHERHQRANSKRNCDGRRIACGRDHFLRQRFFAGAETDHAAPSITLGEFAMQFAIARSGPALRTPAASGIQNEKIVEIVSRQFGGGELLRPAGEWRAESAAWIFSRRRVPRASDCGRLYVRLADSGDRCKKERPDLRARSCFEIRYGAALLKRRRSARIYRAPENLSRRNISRRASGRRLRESPRRSSDRARMASFNRRIALEKPRPFGVDDPINAASGNVSRRAAAAGRA